MTIAYMTQNQFNAVSKWLIRIAPFLSLLAGVYYRVAEQHSCLLQLCNWVRYGIVAVWVVGPPAWLWYDWFKFGNNATPPEREYMMHIHDLARNCWLAFVAVLCVLLKVKLDLA